jgi:hypothetical protein
MAAANPALITRRPDASRHPTPSVSSSMTIGPATRRGTRWTRPASGSPHLLVLATLCTHDDEEPEARVGKVLRLLEEPTVYFARDPDWQQLYRALDPVHGEPPPVDETISDLAERELAVLRMPQLILERMKLDLLSKSPSPPVGARE